MRPPTTPTTVAGRPPQQLLLNLPFIIFSSLATSTRWKDEGVEERERGGTCALGGRERYGVESVLLIYFDLRVVKGLSWYKTWATCA
ncbi:hypothetical protein L195_g055079, partial [Trifolium pratense]